MENSRSWTGERGTLALKRPASSVVVLELSGRDAAAPLELFIDARGAKSAGVEVSGAWAIWMGKRRARLSRVHFLTGTPFITLSAKLVRSFSA